METICAIIIGLVSSAACYFIGRTEGRKSEYQRILARFRQSPKNLFEDIQYDAELPPASRKEHITDY